MTHHVHDTDVRHSAGDCRRNDARGACLRRGAAQADGNSGRAGSEANSAELVAAAFDAAPAREACCAAGAAEEPEETGRTARASPARAGVDSDRTLSAGRGLPTDGLPALRTEAGGPRPRTAAASGVGRAGDPAAGQRIPAASADLSVLRRDDLRRIAAGSAAKVRPARGWWPWRLC